MLPASPQPFLDVEDWRFAVTFTDPASGQPFDLTGSLLKVDFVTHGSGLPVQSCSNIDEDDSLIVESPATAGRVTFVARAADRDWMAPPLSQGVASLVSIIGDVIRRASNAPDAAVEALGRIAFTVQASTTRW